MLISKELDKTRAHLNFMTKHRQTLTFSVHCIAYSTVSDFAKFWLKNVKLFWPNKQVTSNSILSNCFIQFLLFWMKIYLRIISYFTFLDKKYFQNSIIGFGFSNRPKAEFYRSRLFCFGRLWKLQPRSLSVFLVKFWHFQPLLRFPQAAFYILRHNYP